MKLDKISPTRLDSYLRCPYLFHLLDKEVLGEKRVDDTLTHLASWEFGNFAHEALEKFGTSELKDSTDAGAIAEYLTKTADELFAARFGEKVPSKVMPQLEDLKTRLHSFAAAQAEWRSQGWEIKDAEKRLEMMLDDTLIYGKCDRIDFNPLKNEWCVIDYKTFEASECKESISLQLPLYAAMIGEHQAKRVYCRLGYGARAHFTEASAPTVEEAIELARQTIDKIEREIFSPPVPNSVWEHDFGDYLNNPLMQLFDLLKLADHPGDRLSYLHFTRSDLAKARYPEGVPPILKLSAEMADLLADKGLAGFFAELNEYLKFDLSALIAAAKDFEANLSVTERLSDFKFSRSE